MVTLQDLRDEAVRRIETTFANLYLRWEAEKGTNKGAALMVEALPVIFGTVHSRMMGPGSTGKTSLVHALSGRDAHSDYKESRTFDLGDPVVKGDFEIFVGEGANQRSFKNERLSYIILAQPGQETWYKEKLGYSSFTRTFILAGDCEDISANFKTAARHFWDEFAGREADAPTLVLYAVTKIDNSPNVMETYKSKGEAAALETAERLWPVETIMEATRIDGHPPILGFPAYTSAYEKWGFPQFMDTNYNVNGLNKEEHMMRYCQNLNMEGLSAFAKTFPEANSALLQVAHQKRASKK